MRRSRVLIERPFKQWSCKAFLFAGILLVGAPSHLVLDHFTSVSTPAWLIAPVVLTGLMSSLVGLLTFYPRLSDRTVWLNIAGAVNVVIAGVGTIGILGWALAASILPIVSEVSISTVPPAPVFLVVMMTMALAFVLSGIASLLTVDLSKIVGLLMLSFAVPWIVVVAATLMFGSEVPTWLSFPVYGAMPLILLATSHVLRRHPHSEEFEEPSGDIAAG